MPDPRTLVVLGALIAGMTVTSLFLLAVEGDGAAPPLGGVLQVTDSKVSSEQRLFDTATPRQWEAIVISDSGSAVGNADYLAELHQAVYDGLACHMVVNNGSEAQDGAIELGYRWRQQQLGRYREMASGHTMPQAIEICLIGDTRAESPTQRQQEELVWLVRTLQDQYNIPASQVYLDLGDAAHPTRFNALAFQEQILP